MENVTIITENIYDGPIIQAILKSKIKNLELISSHGYSSALSKARSLLIGNKKIILLLNSDSTNKKEKIDFIQYYLPISDRSQFKLILFDPEFEILFIENESFMKKHLPDGQHKDLLVYAKLAPLLFISTTLHLEKPQLLLELTDPNILNDFYKSTYISDIINFANQPNYTEVR